jgi:glutamine synthetase
MNYTHKLCSGLESKKNLGLPCKAEQALVQQLSEGCDALYENVEQLKKVLAQVSGNAKDAATYYHDVVIPAMNAVRAEADKLEILTDKACWPYPTYSDLLYY